jgi:hypothetical protein
LPDTEKRVQIVYISDRPSMLRETLAYVAAFMPFINDRLVVCPSRLKGEFQRVGGVVTIAEEDVLGSQASGRDLWPDHAARNYFLRTRLAWLADVAEEFIMADDDYRPLKRIEPTYYKSDAKHQPYFFYTAERWLSVIHRRRPTSFDVGIANTAEQLRAHDLGTLLFSSHMPQIIFRDVFRESAEFFAEAAVRAGSLTEWETYFNFALARSPERFHPPKPFAVLGWPDRPHWPWWVRPPEFNFENFYEGAYGDGGLFAGLPTGYDPQSHAGVTAEKIRRYLAFFAAEQVRRDKRRNRRETFRRITRLRPSSRLFDRLTAWPARPLRGQPAPSGGPWRIAGLFQYPTGLGNAAAALHRTLMAAAPSQLIERIDLSDAFSAGNRSAEPLDGSLLAGARTLIVGVNPIEGAQWLRRMRPSSRRRMRIVGYWWWEFPSFPETWRPYLRHFDEIWVSSRFIHDAWCGRVDVPVRWVPLDLREPEVEGADVIESVGRRRPLLKLLSVINLGSTLSRKNPAGAMVVFRELRRALGDEVSFTLKVGGMESYPERYAELLNLGLDEPGLTVRVSPLSDANFNRLVDDHDMYISMHRAEGLGLILAKAMARRKTVVATRWSGNLDFMRDDCSLLVDFMSTTIQDENRNSSAALTCAEPHYADAVRRVLEAVMENRLTELGRRAHNAIEAVSEAAVAHNRRQIFGM